MTNTILGKIHFGGRDFVHTATTMYCRPDGEVCYEPYLDIPPAFDAEIRERTSPHTYREDHWMGSKGECLICGHAPDHPCHGGA